MQIKVFYNKSCKLCKTEINHYKKHSDNSFLWIDIIDNDHAIKTTSKSLKQLIRRIHVIKDGQLLEGASAFLEIWKNIPKYRFLYYLFRIKFCFFFLHLLYEIVAYFLFLKNKNLLNKNE